MFSGCSMMLSHNKISDSEISSSLASNDDKQKKSFRLYNAMTRGQKRCCSLGNHRKESLICDISTAISILEVELSRKHLLAKDTEPKPNRKAELENWREIKALKKCLNRGRDLIFNRCCKSADDTWPRAIMVSYERAWLVQQKIKQRAIMLTFIHGNETNELP